MVVLNALSGHPIFDQEDQLLCAYGQLRFQLYYLSFKLIYFFLEMSRSAFVVLGFFLLNLGLTDQKSVIVERAQALNFRDHYLYH